MSTADITECDRIPVTTPARTLLDLATCVGPGPLEAAISEADRLDLVSPDGLHQFVEGRGGLDGIRRLRSILDQQTFRLTDSELERRFLRLVREAGLAMPLTRQRVNGFQVDFYWPTLGLIVETDGLRYHRTATQQSKDRIRDQAHAAAGFAALRFTHAQVTFNPGHVISTMRSVADRRRQRLF
jgi:very-short-patch-repair endonuclease